MSNPDTQEGVANAHARLTSPEFLATIKALSERGKSTQALVRVAKAAGKHEETMTYILRNKGIWGFTKTLVSLQKQTKRDLLNDIWKEHGEAVSGPILARL